MPQRDENLVGTLLIQTCKKLTQQTLSKLTQQSLKTQARQPTHRNALKGRHFSNRAATTHNHDDVLRECRCAASVLHKSEINLAPSRRFQVTSVSDTGRIRYHQRGYVERSFGVSEDTYFNDYLQVSVEFCALSLQSGLGKFGALAGGTNLGKPGVGGARRLRFFGRLGFGLTLLWRFFLLCRVLCPCVCLS
jgi:hypothetical protein